MRIRPEHPTDPGAAAWLEQLDAALEGQTGDHAAESWRSLRDDVRALVPPLDPELQRRIEQRIAKRAQHRRLSVLTAGPAGRWTRSQAGRRGPRGTARSARVAGWIRPRIPGWIRPGALIGPAAALAVTVTLVVALVVVAPWRSGERRSPASSSSVPAGPRSAGRSAHAPLTFGPATGRAAEARPPVAAPPVFRGKVRGSTKSSAGVPGAAAGGASRAEAPLAAAPPAPERKQQLAASMTLGPEKEAVQSTSERVEKIVVQDGGFVAHSNVEVQRAGTDEANLALEIPSAKLGSAMAALGRLAPVEAENHSLQDITSPYEAASRRLADARTERRALLRALSHANTAAAIASLHERLSQVAATISEAGNALQAEARRASTAEMEVTIVGQSRGAPPHTGSGGLTIDRGLRDAGHVLAGALAVLLVAGAVLVPLALILLALAAAWRAWRRYQREQALNAP